MADGSVIIKVDADTKRAQSELARLEKGLQKTAAAMEKTGSERNAIADQLDAAQQKAEATKGTIQELKTQLSQTSRDLSGRGADMTPGDMDAAKQVQKELAVEIAQQEKALAAQERTVSSLEAKETSLTSKLQQQTAEYEKQREAVGGLRRQLMQSGGQAMQRLKAGAANVTKSFNASFKTILKYALGIRSLYFLFRKLRAALKEGLLDYASKDPETKANIDSLKASLNGLKLAWGAAFAPIVNAVIPWLVKLVDWLTTAANAIAQFFAALSGKTTYKKAVKNMDSVASAAGGAGDAAEEAKKQIMGFDEINRLEDNKSGGGGGGGGGGGLGDLEETEINPKILSAVEWLKNHLQEIALIAGTIGAILLAWKLSNLLGVSFQKILGVIMIIYGAVMLVKGAIDAWKNGLDDSNMATMLGGIAIAALGAALAFGAIGAAIALLVGGIVFLVLGFKELVTQGELTDEAFRALATGVLLVGAAFALLTGSWIPLLVAAVVALVLAIIKYWDEIKAYTIKVWNAIKAFFVKIWTDIKNKATEIWNNIKNTAVEKWNGIKDSIIGVWDRVKDGISEKWNEITDWFRGKWDDLKQWWENLTLNPFHIMVPHLEWYWSEAGGFVARVLSTLGLPAQIPHLSVSWYAKGGIVDGATLIGAGEAGKEAIVPLERNTGWIKKVATELLDAMESKFDGVLSGMPAMAMGGVAPPRALNSSGSMFSDGDIERLINGFAAALGVGGGSGDQRIQLIVDGRKMAEVVTKHQNEMARGYGR